jgi:hypothetical protein
MKNIHLIPTSQQSRLHLAYNKNYYLSIEPFVQLDTKNYKSFNIYITNDEEIKEGDWHLNIVTHKISKYNIGLLNPNRSNYKKIILTDNKDLIKDGVQAIDDEFLECFVKNLSCEYVEIKEKQHFEVDKSKRINPLNGVFYSYKIIIPKEEPKQETIEEAADIERIAMDKLKNKWGHLYTFGYPQRPFPTNYENDLNNIKIGLYEGAKWQKEKDKNKYSEEEVIEFIKTFDIEFHSGIVERNKGVNKWFEQFKNK